MYAMDAVREIAKRRGISLYRISLDMGKTRQYINATITNNSTPKVDTLSNMIGVCGYGLYAIADEEKDALPDTAIPINN